MANINVSTIRLIFQLRNTVARKIFMISYEPLWQTLKEKNISQYRLINEFHISAGQLSRLRANAHISTHTLDSLCKILDCEISDIIVYKKE